ncbi:c-type cytochrome [Cognatilysobacter bugurensis]|uniref:Cytochrome c n=1 Tax=Cognatilysobacter bugurensis TaxID=543356 RepID=A0A918T215_9GAMM|nr:c-type cytochrome [Lysobacter bugurensis]GHA85508.1 cytochrome c [Lysobacter bugurensis]
MTRNTVIRGVLDGLAYWPRRAWHCLIDGGWKAVLCRVLGLGAVAAIGGLLFVALGLPSIAASQPHWPVTKRLLEIVMTHTVRMRTLGEQAPPLDDPALVLRGAGHYATGCAPCHSAPGQRASLIVQGMLPSPPKLPEDMHNLAPSEMFWIVKHGLKYTSMPAWPAPKREDEVWAMVAFLRALPSLDPAEYRRLAYGELMPEAGIGRDGAYLATLQTPPQTALANCARCHGEDGTGRGLGAFPKLAGQRETYLLASLRAYGSGERHSGVMQPIAAGLSDPQMRALARHYASLAPTGATPAVGTPAANPGHDADLIARGERLATDGDAPRRIPACRQCHGPGAVVRHPLHPDLANQYRDYLALQLQLFRDGHRGGTPRAHVMRHAALALTPGDIDALSAYYASLPAPAPAAARAAR